MATPGPTTEACTTTSSSSTNNNNNNIAGPPISVKSCLCGSVQHASTSGVGQRIRSSGTSAKCRICRTKPRFLLRSQRSLDLQAAAAGPASLANSPARTGTTAPNTGVQDAPRRRARSAERYDGMRVNTGQQPRPTLELYRVRVPPPRQNNLQSPLQPPSVSSLRVEEDPSRRENSRSPPPDYSPPSRVSLLPASMLAAPASPPPSYEEAERSKKALSPPSYEESVAQSGGPPVVTSERPTPGVSASTRQQQQQQAQVQAVLQQLRAAASAGNYQSSVQQNTQQHACSCSKCQASSSTMPRSIRTGSTAAVANGTELRVALPPETSAAIPTSTTTTQYLRSPGAGALSASSHDQCSCYKCQSRYGSTYGDSLGDNDVLLTLETQTAMQGVLTDGVALCSLV